MEYNAIEFFQNVAVRSRPLEAYIDEKLTPSQNADSVADHIASTVIEVLDERDYFRGRAIKHGSFARRTNLATPGVSDVDVLCFIEEDSDGYEISCLRDFERVRVDALMEIRDHLVQNLHIWFHEVTVHQFWAGLCVSFLIKTSYRAHTWKVDVIIAFDGANHIEVLREMQTMTRTEANHNANALSEERNDFLNDYLDYYPQLR